MGRRSTRRVSNKPNVSQVTPEDIEAQPLEPYPDGIQPDASPRLFARDREMIVFSKPFRRLAKKTQVYLTGPGSEHLRTRLTHTLEVAQIAKTIAVAVGADMDLTEAIALGHDVGHTPFGHAGERQLNRILQGDESLPARVANRMSSEPKAKRYYGNFKHNFQSVRLLTFLEQYQPAYDGLNLTLQCLEGILKHTTLHYEKKKALPCKYPDAARQSFWAKLINTSDWCSTRAGQVVAAADAIAQVAHDLSDAIELGALSLRELADRSDVKSALLAVNASAEPGPPTLDNGSIGSAQLLSSIISYFVRHTTAAILESLRGMEGPVTSNLLPNGPEPFEHFHTLEEFKDNLGDIVKSCG